MKLAAIITCLLTAHPECEQQYGLRIEPRACHQSW